MMLTSRNVSAVSNARNPTVEGGTAGRREGDGNIGWQLIFGRSVRFTPVHTQLRCFSHYLSMFHNKKNTGKPHIQHAPGDARLTGHRPHVSLARLQAARASSKPLALSSLAGLRGQEGSGYTREIFSVSLQMREISRREQMREIFVPCRSILRTHAANCGT